MPRQSQLSEVENPPRHISEIIPDVMAKLEAMTAEAVKRRKGLEKFATNHPKQKPCPKGGPAHVIDMDESSRETWKNGHFELVYAPCWKCRLGDESQWLKNAGVSERLLESALETWKPRTEGDREALRVVAKFAGGGNGFLVISGSVGLGKSHLAVAIMRKRRCGRIITQNRLLLKLRERYRDEYAENVLEKCKTAKLLVLDEFGFMTGARDELPALYEILDYRHGEMLPTVLTTNVAVDQFDQAFGDRIADRLRCHQPFVVLKGESWRGR